MIEALTLLLSTITLILQRRDRSKERAGIDEDQLYAELLDLHFAARSWSRAAQSTNTEVQQWIAADMPAEVPNTFFRAVQYNTGWIETVWMRLGEEEDALQKVLSVYAPDVAERLSVVLAERAQILERFAVELRRIKESPPEVAQDFARSLNQQVKDLNGAVEGLETLIRGLRPIAES